MRLSLAHFFILYVTLFLALGLLTWFNFALARRRSRLSGRRIFLCETCRFRFAEQIPYRKPRCPKCGADRYNELLD